MIKIAAVGDLHTYENLKGFLESGFRKINNEADLFIMAGDLTASGKILEIKTLIGELSDIEIPIVAVLGNHDYHRNNQERISELLLQNNIHVLDGGCISFLVGDKTIGVTGTKGFCGGYSKYSIPDFGEKSLRLLVDEIKFESLKIASGLRNLKTDYKIVAMHYSPSIETLIGEDPQIYFFLGGSILAEPIDKYKPNIVFHGHTHFGKKKGFTKGGIPVMNVSMPMIKKPYQLVNLPIE